MVASAPVFSPDGERIAFACTGKGGDGVCVIAADGSEPVPQRLARTEGRPASGPAFTPDGRIAFTGSHGTVDAVYTIAAGARAQPVLLVDLGERGGDPAFPAAGARLAYVGLLDGGSYLHVVDPDGTDRRRIGPPGAYEPAFSPDGQTIVFVRAVTRDGRTDYDLAGIGADGSAQTPLTDDAGSDDHHPAFAPDGRTVAFDRSRDGGAPAVFTVGTDGGPEELLVPAGAEPAFSPDGRRVAFVRDHEIWVVGADGTGERQLTSGAEPADEIPGAGP